MTLVVRDSFKRLRVRLHPLGAASVAALVSDSTPPLNLAPLMAGEPAPRPVDKPGDKGRYRNGRRPRGNGTGTDVPVFVPVATVVRRRLRRLRRCVGSAKSLINMGLFVVPVERIELPTFGLQNRCSTAELNRRT
jgi:hypothetical protein